MEININFVLFKELQEKADDTRAVARIVIIRESKDANLSLKKGAAGFHPFD
jgi:hypothetical protein